MAKLGLRVLLMGDQEKLIPHKNIVLCICAIFLGMEHVLFSSLLYYKNTPMVSCNTTLISFHPQRAEEGSHSIQN